MTYALAGTPAFAAGPMSLLQLIHAKAAALQPVTGRIAEYMGQNKIKKLPPPEQNTNSVLRRRKFSGENYLRRKMGAAYPQGAGGAHIASKLATALLQAKAVCRQRLLLQARSFGNFWRVIAAL